MNHQTTTNFIREPEKFPKVRTMPDGWSFSENSEPAIPNQKAEDSTNKPAANTRPQVERSPEAFPGTDIYPKSWDLSDNS